MQAWTASLHTGELDHGKRERNQHPHPHLASETIRTRSYHAINCLAAQLMFMSTNAETDAAWNE